MRAGPVLLSATLIFPLADSVLSARNATPGGLPRRESATHQRRNGGAKCVIVHRRICLITSVNFTHAAQERNGEVGVLVRDAEQVCRLPDGFDGLATDGLMPVALGRIPRSR